MNEIWVTVEPNTNEIKATLTQFADGMKRNYKPNTNKIRTGIRTKYR